MEDEEINTTNLDTRHSFSPPQSRGRQVRTRNHEEEYFQEHDHASETRNSFSSPQWRRVRIEKQYEAYQQEQHEDDFVQTETYMSDDEQEQQHEGDFVQTETYMSDDEHEEENIGSTSHVTRKETRALGETRKSRLKKGSLVFQVDESFGRVVGNDSQGFITKGGCVMRKYAKVDGTTWKKQPDLLKTDIISKTIENSDFDFKCSQMSGAMSSQLGYQHRNYQYRLHPLIYKKYEMMEEAMTHPSPGIKVSDWVKLCERFASPSFQKISEKNKKNRSLNLVPPTVGTRSLPRRVHMSRGEGKEVTEFEQLVKKVERNDQ